jgi:carboxylate-amine ligase
MTARDAVAELIEELAPVAAELGCAGELVDVKAILELGPSYARQRAIVARGGSLQDVVRALVEELATDQPGAGLLP